MHHPQEWGCPWGLCAVTGKGVALTAVLDLPFPALRCSVQPLGAWGLACSSLGRGLRGFQEGEVMQVQSLGAWGLAGSYTMEGAAGVPGGIGDAGVQGTEDPGGRRGPWPSPQRGAAQQCRGSQERGRRNPRVASGGSGRKLDLSQDWVGALGGWAGGDRKQFLQSRAGVRASSGQALPPRPGVPLPLLADLRPVSQLLLPHLGLSGLCCRMLRGLRRGQCCPGQMSVVQEQSSRQPAAGAPSPGDSRPLAGSAVLEGRLLLETDVMHQNIYDYIHVDDRQDFCRQLHWAMDPPQVVFGQPPPLETGDDAILGRLLRAQEWGAGAPTEYSAFLTRCFICRVRCLLDSTSGFLTMQFQGKLKFLFGQKKKAPSGAMLLPRLSLFCIAAPVLLPSAAEMKMRSALLRAKPRADTAVTTDAKVKATTSLCESELHGKPNYSAGRSSRESGVLVLREQTDAGRWAQVPARAPCLCLRGGPDLVLDPKGGSGDREEEQHRMLSRASGVTGRRETPGPTKPLPWTAGKHSEDGARPRLQPSKNDPPSLRPMPRGSCLPYPCVQGTFRNSPISHPLSPSPSAYSSRTSRPMRDVGEDQVHPPLCHFPQGSLQHRLPQPGAQRFATRGYPMEDVKLQGVPMPPGDLCGPTLLLDVPIKMEKDSGSEDAADGYVPSQVWLGATDRSHPATFPTRMHLKTEPDSQQQVYISHLGHGVRGAQPQGRATAGRSRELTPFHPAHCACLEPTHGLPQPEPPHQLCARGRGEQSCACRAAEAAPVVKREPLDSPHWATHSQGVVPGMFPKSALATLVPPQASECTFLP
ncbi:aryl hydrocarbon receptor repressor isoform X2 [Pongo pygmaeus]|uniref:aryl hydrocarbon receptor repressor isoform X2 n=1 Tax=Pongo pygmaeus TaxID=9600 RepID=UPI00300C3196